jgi:hypothetical protein
MAILEHSALAKPVLLTDAEVREVAGGSILLALLAACKGCTNDSDPLDGPGETGGTGS